LLRAEGISVEISDRTILEKISVILRKGELVALLGPNGSGKSTLLRTIFGILKPHCGVVYIDGKEIHELERREIAKILGYLPQEVEGANLRVLDIVLLGRVPHTGIMPTKRDIEVSLKALKLVGMEEYRERLFSELSGGEKQKVMLARIFSQEVEFLLLDEPTSHLDIKSQIDVMKIVKMLVASGKGALVALHDINLAAMFADRILMVKNGKIKYSGRVKEVLTPENIKEIYGIDVEVLNHDGSIFIIPKIP